MQGDHQISTPQKVKAILDMSGCNMRAGMCRAPEALAMPEPTRDLLPVQTETCLRLSDSSDRPLSSELVSELCAAAPVTLSLSAQIVFANLLHGLHARRIRTAQPFVSQTRRGLLRGPQQLLPESRRDASESANCPSLSHLSVSVSPQHAAKAGRRPPALRVL